MSKLRNFIEQGPVLCGVTGGDGVNAQRWAFILLAAFDAEILNKGSVFALQDGESVASRLDVLNGLYRANGADPFKVDFFVHVIELAAMSYAMSKGFLEYEGPRDRLYGCLKTSELDNAKMSAVYSVDDALIQSNWA